MIQQTRASSSSLSLNGNLAPNEGKTHGVEPEGFQSMKGVDGAALNKWIESRRGRLEDGKDLTADDRIFLACQFMFDHRNMNPYDVRANIAKLYFYPVDVDNLEYNADSGVTITLADGGTKTVAAFVPYDGRDTNGRHYLVDLTDDGNVLSDGTIYVGMPGSFAHAARGAIWSDFSKKNPGKERGGPEHNKYVLELIYAHKIAVQKTAESGLPSLQDVLKSGMSPATVMQQVVMAVASAAVDPVYKRACSPSEMTLEDEALVQNIMDSKYGIRVNLNADNPLDGSSTAEWIDPPKPKKGPAPKVEPDVRGASGEMVFRLGKELEQLRKWQGAPSGTFHFGGPNRNGAGDAAWACSGLTEELSVNEASGDRDVAIEAYASFLGAWRALSELQANEPMPPGPESTPEQQEAFQEVMSAHNARVNQLQTAMNNAGEGLRLSCGGMTLDGDREWTEDQLDAAIYQFGAMDKVIRGSGDTIHAATLGKFALGILQDQWSGFGVPDQPLNVAAASSLVAAWRAWIEALRGESETAGGLKKDLDDEVSAMAGG